MRRVINPGRFPRFIGPVMVALPHRVTCQIGFESEQRNTGKALTGTLWVCIGAFAPTLGESTITFKTPRLVFPSSRLATAEKFTGSGAANVASHRTVRIASQLSANEPMKIFLLSLFVSGLAAAMTRHTRRVLS